LTGTVGPGRAAIAIAFAAIVFLTGDASGSVGPTVARDLLTEANIQLVGAPVATVASAGDVNGDGVPDLLIGAPSASYSGRSGSGAVYVVFAQPNMTSVDLGSLGSDGYQIGGAVAGAQAGAAVANAGDINGDGIPDAIVGAPGEFADGAVYVVFGKATTTAVDLSSLGTQGFRISDGRTCYCIPSGTTWGSIGNEVAGPGDVNGDGRPDILIGQRQSPDGSNGEAAFVVFGKADTSAVDLTSLGAGGYRINTDGFSPAISSAGDINGDGLNDVLVSTSQAPNPPDPTPYTGKVYVVFGKADGATIDLASLGSGGYEIDGPSQSAFIGDSIADAGDVNGDGVPDQLIGGGITGKTYVVFGQRNSLAPIDLANVGTQGFTQGYAIWGFSPGFGHPVASLGDVNGDGVPDALIGDPSASYTGDHAGAALVVFLHADTSSINTADLGSDGYRLDGAALDVAGSSVADAGDINGDGADDPIITMGGAAYVAFFRPPNDDFGDAQSVSGPVGIVDGTTVGATKEAGEPDHAGNPGGASIWYQWTAQASGQATFSTDGSNFDTLLAAYTGAAVNALTEVASNDNANGLLTSEISFNAVQGTTYSIAIDGAGGDSGLSELSWDLQPSNDNFAAAQVLSGDHGSVDGTTVGATKEPGEPNHAGNAGGSSVWYRWTAPATGTLTVDTCNSNFDTLLAVYTGADVSHLTAVASNDDGPATCGIGGLGSQVTLPVSSGTTYDIAVDGFDGDWGDFALAWTRTNPPPPPPQPPTNSTLPAISGTAKPGQTLTATPGTWNGTAPIAYAYQWDSCDPTGASCVDIPNETTSTYLVSSSDAGSSFRVVVTASNAAGHAAATSASTAAVPTPPPCLAPKLKGKTVTKARRLLHMAHCALGSVTHAHSRLRRGLIVSQRPRAGASRPRGTKVRVVVSRGHRRS
jgi:hypothetical protein